MRRKRYYYVFMLTFIVLVTGVMMTPVGVNENKDVMKNVKRGRSTAVDSGSREAADIYYLRFPLSRHGNGNINCYVPKYKQTDINTVKLYASFFLMPDEYKETDDAYIFTNKSGTITIYKNTQHLRYQSASEGVSFTSPSGLIIQNDEQIIEKAAVFLEEKCMFLSYEEARIFFDGEQYTVTFIDRIGNIKNYAFNNTVTLDQKGQVLQADFYFIKYEKLSACKIKSMRDAYAELPIDIPRNTKISLTNCQLVYVYENSIVQPVYFFEGDATGNRTYECYVKAAVYGT